MAGATAHDTSSFQAVALAAHRFAGVIEINKQSINGERKKKSATRPINQVGFQNFSACQLHGSSFPSH